jgi:hypothetical protein
MKKLLILFVIGFGFVQCDDENGACSTSAIVRNFTGVDGCGYILELENGTMLEPVKILRCGTPPVTNAVGAPIAGFENLKLWDGMRVMISYEETTDASICMAGPLVRVTCIREVVGPTED